MSVLRLRQALALLLLAVLVEGGLLAAGVGQGDRGAHAAAARAVAARGAVREAPLKLPKGTPKLTKLPHGAVAVKLRDRQARNGELAAALRRPVLLRTRPGGPSFARIGTRTGYGAPRVLAVGAVRYGWIGVRTLQRTDGRLAWIPSRAATLRRLHTLLVADLSSRQITLRVNGRVAVADPIGVGRAGSTTPVGRYGVADRLIAKGSAYGCCIITLTGHQPNLPAGWTGGTRIALHGTEEPDSVGQQVSAGCLRMRDADLQKLLPQVPLGTTLVVRE